MGSTTYMLFQAHVSSYDYVAGMKKYILFHRANAMTPPPQRKRIKILRFFVTKGIAF
jgi:hypothetical protein